MSAFKWMSHQAEHLIIALFHGTAIGQEKSSFCKSNAFTDFQKQLHAVVSRLSVKYDNSNGNIL